MASAWFYGKNNQQLGPVSSDQLKQLAASGQLSATDLVWKDGMAEWLPAARIKGLMPATEAVPVPPVPAATPTAPLAYAGSGYAAPTGPIAPPPTARVQIPAEVPPKYRHPGMTPVYLVLTTQGAVVNADFDVSPTMTSLVEGFAKKLGKKYDVNLAPSAPAGAPCVTVRLVHIDQGNRLLRYLLTLFAGKTVFEIEGQVRSISGQSAPFAHKHKGMGGIGGGSGIALLKASANYLGKKLAKQVLK